MKTLLKYGPIMEKGIYRQSAIQTTHERGAAAPK